MHRYITFLLYIFHAYKILMWLEIKSYHIYKKKI